MKRCNTCLEVPKVTVVQVEPVQKRQRFDITRLAHLGMSGNHAVSSWGFNDIESDHMLNLVNSQLQNRLQQLQKKLFEVEWAQKLKESEVYDSRREYSNQFAQYREQQESEMYNQINILRDDINFWIQKLEILKSDSLNQHLALIIHRYQQTLVDLHEDVRQLQNAIEFIKNDKCSLLELI